MGRSEPFRVSLVPWPTLKIREGYWVAQVTLSHWEARNRLWGYLCASFYNTSQQCLFLPLRTSLPKYVRWPSPSDSSGITDRTVVDTLISESRRVSSSLGTPPNGNYFPTLKWRGHPPWTHVHKSKPTAQESRWGLFLPLSSLTEQITARIWFTEAPQRL